jgi:hypothetical protein
MSDINKLVLEAAGQPPSGTHPMGGLTLAKPGTAQNQPPSGTHPMGGLTLAKPGTAQNQPPSGTHPMGGLTLAKSPRLRDTFKKKAGDAVKSGGRGIRDVLWTNRQGAGGKAKALGLAALGTAGLAGVGALAHKLASGDPDESIAAAAEKVSNTKPQVIKQGTGSLKTLGIAGVGAGAGYWAGKQARDQKEQSNKPKLPQLLGTMSHLRKK